MTTDHRLTIEYVPTDQLRPYARNPRNHDDKQLDFLADRIRRSGFTNPLQIDENGQILAGHGRWLAATRAGLTELPCVCLRGLTDAQKRAFIIADNRAYELGDWDKALLASEISDLLLEPDADLDLSDLGFDPDEDRELLALLPDDDVDQLLGLKPRPTRQEASATHNAPDADDYADVGEGATNPSENKGITYPVILQIDKPTFALWRKAKGKGSDSDAITALLELRRLVTEYLPVDPTDIDAVAAAFADMAQDAAAGTTGEATA